MKAVVVEPRQPRTARVVELPDPVPALHEVRVRVLEVGICGTDAEINDGLYGKAPEGEPFLVLGHEGLGQLPTGELVVPIVRRPSGRGDGSYGGARRVVVNTFGRRAISVGSGRTRNANRSHCAEKPVK